jgi:hypothetical protein
MILFTEHSKNLILAGKKTQTRRRGKKRWNIGSIHECRRGFKGEPFARVRILSVDKVRLGDITEEDARAEGAKDKTEFIEVWRQIYGPWKADEEVWRINFAVVDRQ